VPQAGLRPTRSHNSALVRRRPASIGRMPPLGADVFNSQKQPKFGPVAAAFAPHARSTVIRVLDQQVPLPSSEAGLIEECRAMTADVATLKPKSLADRVARNVSRGNRAVLRMTMRHTGSPLGESTDEAPTPYYDRLMSAIHATALENRRVSQGDGVDVPPAANGRRRIRRLILCAAALIVAAAAGQTMLGSGVSQRQPPVAAANKAPEGRSPVVGSANAGEEPVGRPLPAAAPDGSERTGVDGERTAAGGVGMGPALAAKTDEQPVAAPVAGEPAEGPGSGVEARYDGAVHASSATEGMRSDPIASATNPASEQSLPAPTPSPSAPSPPAPASETGSTVDRANDPATIRVAQAISDVNLRAGPSNGQAVLATIPRGSPVDVINCRQWCEVIFAGRRGWVYKGFIGASPMRRGP
jgi:hypothetical protein